MRKLCLICFLGLASSLQANTEINTHTGFPGDSLLNVFIAQHAYDQIQWQTQIRILPHNSPPESNLQIGELLGESAYAGYYAYQPVTWETLDGDQKQQVLDDPRLLPWLTWFNGKLKVVSRTGPYETLDRNSLISELTQSLQQKAPAKPTTKQVEGDYGKFTYQIDQKELIQPTPLYLKLLSRSPLPLIPPVEDTPPIEETNPER